jgi:hypothetical protein
MASQQAGLHIAIQRTDHRSGDHAFRCATDAVHHIHFAFRHTGQDRRGDITVGNSENLHPELLHFCDHRIVARFSQRDHR